MLPLLAVLALAAEGVVIEGLEVSVVSVERAKNVSLQDCPPGDNIVRGVIRPVEENEFVTIRIDVNVLPSFEAPELSKPVLIDEAGKEYKTAQAFGVLNASPSYSCSFSFRVPVGTKVSRFAIEEASLDVASLEK
jgi:hypothetical protein